ncbi:MAG TPA: hypothetical protein VGI00_01100 [Streptosporangiaceae bacterium]|jgi:hypothetical protein
MTRFADQLYTDLLHEHGPALDGVRPRSASPRHLASRRVVLAASAGGLAVAATAGTLVAVSGTPAYALTTHSNGSVSLAVYQTAGIAQVNSKLQQLGDRVVVVPVRSGCRPISSLRAAFVPPHDQISVQGTTSSDGSVTVQARGIPAGDILVVGTETSSHGKTRSTETASKLTSDPAPSCVSLPGPGHPGGGSQRG